MDIVKEKKKKITRATFKKFVRENKDLLFVEVHSTFDGMVDGVVAVNDTAIKVTINEEEQDDLHTLGIKGVWLVGHSDDYFSEVNDTLFKGISVMNSCGWFTVKTLKTRGEQNDK